MTQAQKNKIIYLSLTYGFIAVLFQFIVIAIFGENDYKVSTDTLYVAVYPSLSWGVGKTIFSFGSLLSVLAALGAGFCVAYVQTMALDSYKQWRFILATFVLMIASFALRVTEAYLGIDFTHVTMPAEEFNEKKANRKGYNGLFKEFNQADSLYNGKLWKP